MARELIHHLGTGDLLPDVLTPELNIEALAILDAGVRSAASGRMELVGSRAWP